MHAANWYEVIPASSSSGNLARKIAGSAVTPSATVKASTSISTEGFIVLSDSRTTRAAANMQQSHYEEGTLAIIEAFLSC